MLFKWICLLIYYFYSGCQTLDKLEDNSRTVKGAQVISQDTEALTHILGQLQRWSEMSQNSCRLCNLNSLSFYS